MEKVCYYINIAIHDCLKKTAHYLYNEFPKWKNGIVRYRPFWELCCPTIVNCTPCGAIFRTLLDGTARASVNLNGDTIKMRVKHSQKIIKSDSKNITSNSSNTKRHLTGAQKIITFGFTIITISLLNITHASALTYQDEIDMQFTFNPTVSINVTGDLTIPNLAPGSYADSNIITVTAGSNDAHGYTLYSTVGSSSSNYTDLRLSPSNTTNKFTSIGVDTVKTTLASFSDDTWGYSYCLTTNNCDTGSNYWVGGNSDSASTGYKGLPIYDASDNTTGVILASTTTPSETELKFKIGAKASSTQVSGTYTNIINFIGIGKVVTTTYNLTYNANAGSDTVTGMPTNLTSQTTNDGVIALSTATPTRSGYIFKGWCTDGSSETSCSGTLYEPGRIYIIPAASQGGMAIVNMYTVWESTTILPSFYMQDMVAAQCTTNIAFAADKRDEQTYPVVRLNDGKCWMGKDLNIADGTELTGELSNVNTSFTVTAVNYSNTNCDDGSPCYSYYSNNSATLNGQSTYDICPKNWRLPTANEAASLASYYATGEDLVDSPANFIYSGSYYIDTFQGVGETGFYWTSSVGGVLSMWQVLSFSSSTTSVSVLQRGYSAHVRCIFAE